MANRAQLTDKLMKNRWWIIVASIWIQSCSGSSFNFGLYSQAMKLTLQYDQKSLATIAFVKDMGATVGIISGVCLDWFPSWVVISIGSLQTFMGYLMIWLAITQRVPAPLFWQMCVYMFLASNGQTYFNTATVVSSVQTFPATRGMVISLLKSFVGLSAAIMAQLYLAIFQGDSKGYPLMAALLPTSVALLLMFIVRPIPPAYDHNDVTNFYILVAIAVGLASYLMGIVTIQNVLSIGHGAILLISGIIILLPVGVVVKSAFWDGNLNFQSSAKDPLLKNKSESKFRDPVLLHKVSEEVTLLSGKNSGQERNVTVGNTSACDQGPEIGTRAGVDTCTSGCHLNSRIIPDSSRKLAPTEKYLRLNRHPKIGEDYSILQAISTVEFWLLFVSMACAMGSGVTTIDNMGQIGASFGYSDAEVGTFISLLSIWNFLGRLAGGTVADIFLCKYRIARTVFLVITQAAMCVAYFLVSSAVDGSLYVGTAIIGSGFGAQWTIMPAITSELFGLEHFGTIFNAVASASPIGSYFLSVRVLGYLYDVEAKKEMHIHAHRSFLTGWVSGTSGELLCHGPHCFRLTFIIIAGVSLLGCIISIILVARTKTFYEEEIGPNLFVQVEDHSGSSDLESSS